MTPDGSSPSTQSALAVARTLGDVLAEAMAARVARESVIGLERKLDGWIAEHLAEARERLDVPMVEFNADMQALDEAATAIVALSRAMAKITANNVSADGPTQSASALADLFQEEPGHLLFPEAAQVLGGMVACKLVEG
jgi:hypothetical protein